MSPENRQLVPGKSSAEIRADRSDAERELFRRIDDYMVSEKAWRRKELSLDMLAESQLRAFALSIGFRKAV